jgi:hypothetical protein
MRPLSCKASRIEGKGRILLFLSVIITSLLTISGVFARDHGDDFGSATEVAIGIITKGILNKPGDRHYFKFTVTETATYTIVAGRGVNINGKLFNSAYQSITTDHEDRKLGNFRITITLDPDTYYLQVSAYRETETGNYSFRIFKSLDSPNGNKYEGEPRNRSRFPEHPERYRPMPLPDKTKKPPNPRGEDPEIPESHTIEN